MKIHIPSIRLPGLALLLVLQTVATADISPTLFVGSSITAESYTSVEMKSAKVDIVWGTPCKLTATFEMVNHSSSDETVNVGFPMPFVFRRQSRLEDPVSIYFDGHSSPTLGPIKGLGEAAHSWEWYFSEHSFSPGGTTVVVEADLRASRIYGSFYGQAIAYCIETGGKWFGDIGIEDVTIQFPHEITPTQILAVTPEGYRVEGAEIHWSFREFQPFAKEYDIYFEYIRPDVMAVVQRLRDEFEANDHSHSSVIKLAKHLFALGYNRSNAGYPPWRLTPTEFHLLGESILEPQDRVFFSSRYELTEGGVYQEIDSEWTEDRVRLIGIIADTGYRDAESEIPCILEAEQLIGRVLQEDPHNAEAWNVYLANYWRISFAAVGGWSGKRVFSAGQRAAIRKAALNCPEDPHIQLWLAKLQAGDASYGIMATIKEHGILENEFPEITYDYY